MQVGYVGLGKMGGALARRLQLSHPLLVHDIDPAAMERMAAQGARSCDQPASLAAACDVILLSLPTSTEVQQVLFGRAGLAAAVRPGTLIIDQSSGDPIATRSMAQRLDVSGVTLIDAPVSGTAAAAEAGTITIMVGARDEQFARAEPVLAAISRNIFHAGDVGSGQVMKLVNNVLSGGSRLLVMESVALATKNGIDPHRACEILQAGGARSAFLETFMIPHILKGDLSPGFTLDLMHKDVGLACQLGKNTGVPMFFGNLAQEFYKMCIRKLGRRAQVNTAALVMDSMCGTHVVPAPGAAPDAA